VLWLPTLSATMRGDTDLPEAAIRYLVAFTFARIAIGFLARLVTTYAVVEDRREDVTPSDDGIPTAAGLS
jgi:hypothetical protein